jgi:prepilin-type N-terminal cleavage/methylation domain-containing protein
MLFHQSSRSGGFTLIELLIVISIIGIIAGMVIAAYSNASQDSRDVVVRQQQVVLQSALDNWIASATNSETGKAMTVSEAQTAYNAETNSYNRLQLIKSYLDDATLAQFSNNAGQLQSDVMQETSQYVTFGDWADGSYPHVTVQSTSN